MDFNITKTDQIKINKWIESIHDKIIETSTPNQSAIKGNLTYSFTPTTLGMILIVTEHYTNKQLNLTDYEAW